MTALAAPAAAQHATGDQAVVTPTWLAAHLHDRGLVILQVDRPEGYAREHVPGARFATDRTLASDAMPMLEMLPADALRRKLEAYGIGEGSQVVVVFAPDEVAEAARVFFTLGYAGLGDRVRFLDGGLAAWKGARQPVTAAVPAAARPGHLTAPILLSAVVDHDFVRALGPARKARLIDARAAVYFNGPKSDMMAAGHIAGATNIPFNSVIDDSERLLPLAQLRERFRAAGVTPGDTVVAYCHIGEQATLVLLAAHLIGYPVRLYDGSFHDWSDRHLPTEIGASTVRESQ